MASISLWFRSFRPCAVVLVCAVSFWSCGMKESHNSGKDQQAFLDFMVRISGNQLKGTKAAVVLSEEGCMQCNKAFGQWMAAHIEDPRYFFIIEAIGTRVDISPFEGASQRTYWDRDQGFQSLGLLEGSGAIFFKEDRIDTIVKLDALQLNAQIQFIEDHAN